MSQPRTASGTGRLIVVVYAIFALSASARSLYQLATKFTEAPLSYSLSALSALVYILATIALAKNLTKLANSALIFELTGVLIVGTLSLVLPADFHHATVWSLYGAGYACIPLILPIWGLWWLRRKRA